MLSSSYFLETGTLFTHLLLFWSDLGLVCKQNYRIVEDIAVMLFNKFLQFAINAHQEGDENPYSRVVAETKEIALQQLPRLSIYGS